MTGAIVCDLCGGIAEDFEWACRWCGAILADVRAEVRREIGAVRRLVRRVARSTWGWLVRTQWLGYAATLFFIGGLAATMAGWSRQTVYLLDTVGGFGLSLNALAHRQGPHIVKNGLFGLLALLALFGLHAAGN